MDEVNAQPTAEQIDELLALAEKATPRPWKDGFITQIDDLLYAHAACNLAPALARRVTELEQRIAALTAPLKCEKCGGRGWTTHGFQSEPTSCPNCLGTGRTERPAVAALRKRFDTTEPSPDNVSSQRRSMCDEILMLLSLLSAAEARILAIEGENRGLESVIASQRRALDEAEAREGKLRKALEPFAKAFDERWMEGNQIVWRPQSLKTYREARAALAPEEPK